MLYFLLDTFIIYAYIIFLKKIFLLFFGGLQKKTADLIYDTSNMVQSWENILSYII